MVFSVNFSENSTLLVLTAGDFDQAIRIWGVNSGECLQPLKDHGGYISLIAFSHDSARPASGLREKTIKIWDVSRGKCLQTLDCKPKSTKGSLKQVTAKM